MKIVRLAEILALKHCLAINPTDLELSLRSKIGNLWIIPNKTHNILRACAEANAQHPKNKDERKAIKGYEFCKQLLSMIDYLKINAEKIKLNKLKEILIIMTDLIIENKINDSKVQFPFVSELIFQMFPAGSKHERKLRDEQYGKANTGLSKIFSIVVGMMEDIKKIEELSPGIFTDMEIPERFMPNRAPLSENDIIDFIRQYGEEYGISSTEDWDLIFMDDPKLKQEITTVINALNRGHNPKDAATLKMQIAEILKNHEERKSSNAHLFEDSMES